MRPDDSRLKIYPTTKLSTGFPVFQIPIKMTEFDFEINCMNAHKLRSLRSFFSREIAIERNERGESKSKSRETNCNRRSDPIDVSSICDNKYLNSIRVVWIGARVYTLFTYIRIDLTLFCLSCTQIRTVSHSNVYTPYSASIVCR